MNCGPSPMVCVSKTKKCWKKCLQALEKHMLQVNERLDGIVTWLKTFALLY